MSELETPERCEYRREPPTAGGRAAPTRGHDGTRLVPWRERGGRCRFRGSRGTGLTLVELVVTTAIVAILASVAVPVVSTTMKRQKEIELRRALRTLRSAIDDYKVTMEQAPQLRAFEKTGAEGYPPDLDTLVKGIDTGELKERKIKFLRRLPIDPMTGKADWIPRSNQQDPGSDFWDRTHVFDIRSASPGVALDGTKYSEW